MPNTMATEVVNCLSLSDAELLISDASRYLIFKPCALPFTVDVASSSCAEYFGAQSELLETRMLSY